MSDTTMRAKTAVRSQVLARSAAHDGLVGAGLGLLLASGLIASDLDIWRNLADSGRPVSSLAILVVGVVVQSAIVCGLGGMALRKLTSAE